MMLFKHKICIIYPDLLYSLQVGIFQNNTLTTKNYPIIKARGKSEFWEGKKSTGIR